jgi:hypothetical protein
MLNRLSAPGARWTPESMQARLSRAQRPGGRFLSPQAATDDGPETLIDAGPLYAGETVKRIDEVRPASEVVRDLTP